MNKKGLTLVELLAVVVIITLIAAIVFPMVSSLLKDSREKSKKADKSSVIEAAKMYIADNPEVIDENVPADCTNSYLGQFTITVNSLIDNGYLEIDSNKYADSSNVTIYIYRTDTTSTNYYYNYLVTLNTN